MPSSSPVNATSRLEESHRRSYSEDVPTGVITWHQALQPLRWRPWAVVLWTLFVENTALAVWAALFVKDDLRLAASFITVTYVVAIALLAFVLPFGALHMPRPQPRSD